MTDLLLERQQLAAKLFSLSGAERRAARLRVQQIDNEYAASLRRSR